MDIFVTKLYYVITLELIIFYYFQTLYTFSAIIRKWYLINNKYSFEIIFIIYDR